ncbi:MAG: polysaccharide biosynthesis/export family protein [Bryobacteraceae bacterium]
MKLILILVAACSVFGQRLPATPAESGGNLPAQPVGASDLLSITVYGAPELSRTLRVTPEGSIRLPMLKQAIEVRGLMPLAIESKLAEGLSAEQILVDPVVTVTIAEFASRPINVAGAVKKPLTFQANGKTTLLDALTRAEGLSGEAGHEILVTQPAKNGVPGFTRKIAVQDLLEKADPAANLALEGGEEIRVPEVGRVFIVGNVLKPGSFPLNDAGGMSVMKALAMAEGLTRFATKQAYIYRPADGPNKEVLVELRKIMDRKSPDVELQAGDIFYIPDNRKGRLTSSVIDKIVSFGAGTASGALVYSAR